MVIDKKILKELYNDRADEVQKYDYGMVIVVGGSELYSGSPVLSALSALRSGADMTHIMAPRRAADIAASFSPALITFPLEGKCLSLDHLPELFSFTRSAEIVSRGRVSVVIGGGAGRTKETKEAIREYLKQVSVPTVIDADAIYAFEEEKIDFSEKPFIFTPHLHEFLVLTGRDIKNIPVEDRGKIVKEEAQKLSSVILLKGKIDFISDGEDLSSNNITVPQLTTGGCGDTLAGIAGALLARGVSPYKAGQGAALINTLAGKIAAEEKGESLIPTDLIDCISKAIK